jgi:hypothetical protein
MDHTRCNPPCHRHITDHPDVPNVRGQVLVKSFNTGVKGMNNSVTFKKWEKRERGEGSGQTFYVK